MNWSWKIGRIAGIGIFLHWTFLILVAWIFISYVAQGESLAAAMLGAGFILALFGCIVLHELGHALTARRYGIETRDIILLPIGGVARLQRMPDQPLQELAVAAAGPAVNVAIAVLIAVAVVVLEGTGALRPGLLAGGRFFQNLMWANVALVLFNLIPAFPMDGGRMLRAILALSMPYQQATNIAASIGQFLAILFAFAGLFWFNNPFLLFIALFVYLGAAAEARLTEVRMLLRDVPVRDAMITRFRALRPDDTLQQAVDELLAGWQTDFPVVENGTFRGMLHRGDLAAALQERGPQAKVGELVQTECKVLTHRDMLDQVMQHLQNGGCSTLPVIQDGRLVGLLTNENLGELMMVRSALQREPGGVSDGELQDKFVPT
jgi:Zn-dependent protease/CBS domain-containing protein